MTVAARPASMPAAERLLRGNVRSALRRFPTDRVFAAVLVVATCLSVASWVITYRLDRVMAYGDSMARELIARRVIDSPTPGVAQFGSVWPPLA
jgi:hypothetical protein